MGPGVTSYFSGHPLPSACHNPPLTPPPAALWQPPGVPAGAQPLHSPQVALHRQRAHHGRRVIHEVGPATSTPTHMTSFHATFSMLACTVFPSQLAHSKEALRALSTCRWEVEVGALSYMSRDHKLAPLFKLTFRRSSLQHPLLAGALGEIRAGELA